MHTGEESKGGESEDGAGLVLLLAAAVHIFGSVPVTCYLCVFVCMGVERVVVAQGLGVVRFMDIMNIFDSREWI